MEEARAEAEEQYEQLELLQIQADRKKRKTGRTAAEKGAQPAGGNAFREEKLRENAMLKGMNLQEGATAMERNSQIGGHKA